MSTAATIASPTAVPRPTAATPASPPGPRTSEGKARSALNALKTGCFARTPTLPGEDLAELEAFVAEIIEDLSPATAVERDLAERVAGLSWRRRRLWRAEEEIITQEFGDRLDDEDLAAEFPTEQHREDAELQAQLDGQAFLAKQFAGREPGTLIRLADHERRLSGSIDASLRMLLKLQDRRARGDVDDATVPAAPNAAIEARSPLLAPARRAEIPPDPPDAPNEAIAPAPNEATSMPTGTQPCGLALKGFAPDLATAPNEPTAGNRAPDACPDWHSVIAAAATSVATRSAASRWRQTKPILPR